MKKRIIQTSLLMVAFMVFGAFSPAGSKKNSKQQKYKNDWVSLRGHQIPSWLKDAKFGIYCHWGIQTLSYIPEYKDLPNDSLIALFKGEHFDADQWAKVFKQAGAKFGGVIGWHGSDFKHWDSQLSDYNSAKMGPHIDIVGEVAKAVRNNGMKFLVSYHSIKTDDWINFAKEGVDKYDPDIFWVDASFGGTKGANHEKTLERSRYIGQNDNPSPMFPEKYQRDFITYFYNKAIEHNKDVQFVYKSYDIPPGVGMRDFENGILNETAYDVWMTDLDMNLPPDWSTHGWFYREGVPLRSADALVDVLMDIVSKNGVLLLNVPPRADGTFTAEVQKKLAGLGKWLHQNGEAVYGTAPWFIYGEGPTVIPEGNYTFHHNDHFGQIAFTAEDIRFTAKGDNLYVTCLGNPGAELLVRALNTKLKVRKGDILSVTQLSSGKQVPFVHNEKGLLLNLKGLSLDDKANAFKIKLDFDL